MTESFGFRCAGHPVSTRRPVAATTLGDLLHRRAAAHPGREALAFPTERASFGELAERAGRLARGLLGLGVRPGDRVGMPPCSPRPTSARSRSR